MNLIFFGDLAAPEEADVRIIKQFLEETNLFKNKIVVGNLEGLITNNAKYSNSLYNNSHIVDLFKDSSKTILSLANNHIKDIPKNFEATIKILQKNDIGYSGAIMLSKENKLNPFEFELDGVRYAVFNHCWKVMSAIMKKKSKDIQVEDEEYSEFIKRIKDYKEQNAETKVIVYFHWNFDFEKLPFPAHRIIAKKLIDNGVDVVIGSHSHLVNGGEVYKGKPIIYGLGNFYIPSGKFFEGKLIYPDDSNTTILLETDLENNEYNVYWIKYDKNNHKIELIKKEGLEQGELIDEYSEYKKMTQKEYNKYFKEKRVKNKLVPIWYNEENCINNKIKDYWILLRMKLFRLIKSILKK